jgi:hypothetical protein
MRKDINKESYKMENCSSPMQDLKPIEILNRNEKLSDEVLKLLDGLQSKLSFITIDRPTTPEPLKNLTDCAKSDLLKRLEAQEKFLIIIQGRVETILNMIDF